MKPVGAMTRVELAGFVSSEFLHQGNRALVKGRG
jgi:hypothetical protein